MRKALGRMKYSTLLAGLLASQFTLAYEPAIDCGSAELVASTIASDVIQYSCFDGSKELRIVLDKDGVRVYDGSHNHAGELHGWFEMHDVEGGLFQRGMYRNGKKVGKWQEFNYETGKVEDVVYKN
jgi:hypothetical protein